MWAAHRSISATDWSAFLRFSDEGDARLTTKEDESNVSGIGESVKEVDWISPTEVDHVAIIIKRNRSSVEQFRNTLTHHFESKFVTFRRGQSFETLVGNKKMGAVKRKNHSHLDEPLLAKQLHHHYCKYGCSEAFYSWCCHIPSISFLCRCGYKNGVFFVARFNFVGGKLIWITTLLMENPLAFFGI